jgi:hypothetical protein
MSEPSITITPQWRRFFESIEPQKFKNIRHGSIHISMLRAPDFYELARRAGVDVPYLAVTPAMEPKSILRRIIDLMMGRHE